VDERERFVEAYRIERTGLEWTLFKGGSQRPLGKSDDAKELVKRAQLFLNGRSASIRIKHETGFEDIRV
jgi:hypothetical protein